MNHRSELTTQYTAGRPAEAMVNRTVATMALARAAAHGDVPATRELLRLVSPRIQRVVKSVMGASHPSADDAVQQALIAFIQGLAAFRGECDPTSYAARIAIRTAIAVRRRARTLSQRAEPMGEIDEASDDATPLEEALAKRRQQLVRELLAEIPEEQAESLALRVVLGWTLEEIAESTGAPLNTVRSRLRLAKEALRRRIEGDPQLLEALEVKP
jgi:RNA polymerase sigma-70 factor (ECF subfamily)